MINRQQSGMFSLEPLICLLIISTLVSGLFNWQQSCYQRVQAQYQQIRALQKGFTMMSILVSLLLTSISVLAICQLHFSVNETRLNLEDFLRQQQSALLFYLAMEPYLDKALFLGCNTAQFQAKMTPLIQIFDESAPFIPAAIKQKNFDHNPILSLRLLTSPILQTLAYQGRDQIKISKNHDLQRGDFILLNDCEQAELHRIQRVDGLILTLDNPIQSQFKLAVTVKHLQYCWFYIATSRFSYQNNKAMHTLFAACEHQPPTSLVRGVKSWKIKLDKQHLEFTWQSESGLSDQSLQWQTNSVLYNAF